MSTFNTELDRLLHSRDASEAEIIEHLLTHYYTDLRHLASNILRDTDEAEDAAQETLIAAVSKLDRYQPGTNFKAWLYTIAVNICRGYLRKRKVQTNLHNVLAGLFHLGDSIPSPEEQALRGEAEAHLWRAVNTLDEKRRLPVVLRYLHGLSNQEIAQVMSIREGTVRSRLHYALRELQKRLKQSDPALARDGSCADDS
jgi:RNA polymerase sigma-70 factor (ECF subfamily)